MLFAEDLLDRKINDASTELTKPSSSVEDAEMPGKADSKAASAGCALNDGSPALVVSVKGSKLQDAVENPWKCTVEGCKNTRGFKRKGDFNRHGNAMHLEKAHSPANDKSKSQPDRTNVEYSNGVTAPPSVNDKLAGPVSDANLTISRKCPKEKVDMREPSTSEEE